MISKCMGFIYEPASDSLAGPRQVSHSLTYSLTHSLPHSLLAGGEPERPSAQRARDLRQNRNGSPMPNFTKKSPRMLYCSCPQHLDTTHELMRFPGALAIPSPCHFRPGATCGDRCFVSPTWFAQARNLVVGGLSARPPPAIDRCCNLRVIHFGQSTCHAISGRGDLSQSRA